MPAGGLVYLDSSAIVKLVVAEPESTALRRYLRGRRARVSCAIARTEVMRAVRHLGASAAGRARQVLQRISLVQIDDGLLEAAALLDPAVVRSLDAIHLAAALSLSAQLEAVVTYDARMADAGRQLGVQVVAPR